MKKYRGMRKDNNEWVYGNRLELDNKVFIIPFDTELTELVEKMGDEDSGLDSVTKWGLQIVLIEVIPETVGLLVGKTDIGKEEIYIGDKTIQEDDGTFGVVTFKDGQFGLDIYEILEDGKWDFIEFDTCVYLDRTGFDGTIHDERMKP